MNKTVQRAALRTAISHAHPVDLDVVKLETLPAGARVATNDGGHYIRTDRTCFCFCDLKTGAMCSAKDICYRHGGVQTQDLAYYPEH